MRGAVYVKINNNANEYSFFEILSRKNVEKLIDKLDTSDIYETTYKIAEECDYGKFVKTYLDVRDGEIYSSCIEEGNTILPFNNFYRVELCSINSDIEHRGDMSYLNETENEEYIEGLNIYWSDIDEYADVKGIDLGEREQFYNEGDGSSFEFNYDDIDEQLDNLYKNQCDELQIDRNELCVIYKAE